MLSKQNKLIIEANKRGYLIKNNGTAIGLKNNVLKLNINPKGYYSFNMRFEGGKPTRIFVHKLQAYQKFGDELFNKELQVRHLNGVPSDNSIDNIKLGTGSENMLDILKVDRVKKANMAWKVANPRTENERYKIYDALNEGLSYKEIKEKLGISKGTLSYIKNHSKEYKKYIEG